MIRSCESSTSLRMTARENWFLRQAIRQSGNCLHQVVVDHHHCKQHEEHERGLIDAFFDVYADVAAHEAFNQQEQDHSAVENGNWQQVEDSEVEADRDSEAH